MSTREWYINKAREAAQFSKDPSTKVGAVLASRLIEAQAINDFPANVPPDAWNDRETKYKFVVHAEVAALMKVGDTYRSGSTLYVTHHPCRDCAKFIAFAGVKRVVCPEGPWRDDPEVIASVEDAKMIFKTCGVETAYHCEGE